MNTNLCPICRLVKPNLTKQFCSQICANKEMARRSHLKAKPRASKCVVCGDALISFGTWAKIYCSKSCSNKAKNERRRIQKEENVKSTGKKCEYCQNQVLRVLSKDGGRFCSSVCARKHSTEVKKEKIWLFKCKRCGSPQEVKGGSQNRSLCDSCRTPKGKYGVIKQKLWQCPEFKERELERRHTERVKRIKEKVDAIFLGDIKTPKSVQFKEWLWLAGYKERRCEECEGKEEWNGKPLSLQLHHVDGDKHNNSLSNLSILCPNCHSQTSNFRWKNTKQHKKYTGVSPSPADGVGL